MKPSKRKKSKKSENIRSLHVKNPPSKIVPKRNIQLIRRKLSTYAFRLRRSFIKPFIYLIRHYEIRDDFRQIYKAHVEELYRNPKLKKRIRLSKKKWEQKISDFRDESLKVDPRELITHYLNDILIKIRVIKELITRFLEYAWVFFIVVFALFRLNFIPIFEYAQSLVSYFVILPIIFLISAAILYKKWLKLDTKLFHMINGRLAFNALDIYRSKRHRRYSDTNLISMAVWNKSLSNYSNVTIIFSMLCIKIVSKRLIYHYIVKALKEISPKYLEDYSINPKDTKTIAKKIKNDWYKQFPIWRKEAKNLKEQNQIEKDSRKETKEISTAGFEH